jgi:ABC-type uncharacterized transport system ATPase subunit
LGAACLLRVDKKPAEPKAPVLEVENLTVTDSRGVEVVKNVSFKVHEGEIVGIAGVSGNGQSELLETLSGIRRATRGTLKINGETIDLATRAPDAADMRAKSMGHVPEDRHRMGLISVSPSMRIPFSAITVTQLIQKAFCSTPRDQEKCGR